MTEPHHHDRDTVVVRDGNGTGMGTILGIIAILVLLAAVWYVTLGPGAGGATTDESGGDTNTAPSLTVPTEAPAAS